MEWADRKRGGEVKEKEGESNNSRTWMCGIQFGSKMRSQSRMLVLSGGPLILSSFSSGALSYHVMTPAPSQPLPTAVLYSYSRFCTATPQRHGNTNILDYGLNLYLIQFAHSSWVLLCSPSLSPLPLPLSVYTCIPIPIPSSHACHSLHCTLGYILISVALPEGGGFWGSSSPPFPYIAGP